jgi:L-lysine exporter family protein LysE/ArgO
MKLKYFIEVIYMLETFLQGLLLGISYVAPIGTQNLYVINSALQKTTAKAYKTAFITIFFDISLAISCFFGVGLIINRLPFLKTLLLFVGGLMVIYIGIGLLKYKPNLDTNIKIHSSTLKIISTCFIVTWLNPQAIIDGSLLLGSFKVSMPFDMSKYFILGVCTASTLWFSILTTLVLKFKNFFSVKILIWLNRFCGAVIVFYGIKLIVSFFSTL